MVFSSWEVDWGLKDQDGLDMLRKGDGRQSATEVDMYGMCPRGNSG